jgi:hypothetical protein
VTPPRIKTAGDLLNDALDVYMPHAMECGADTCTTCDLTINRLRLAYKVWQNSEYKAVSATVLQERAAFDLRLRKLEVLVGGANIEERIETALADQAFAWLAHGKLRETVDRLQARLDAAERRS